MVRTPSEDAANAARNAAGSTDDGARPGPRENHLTAARPKNSSERVTTPPADEPFTTAEMPPFDLALALVKMNTPEGATAPSVLAPPRPSVAAQAPTPLVNVSRSDVARLEAYALATDPSAASASDVAPVEVEFPAGQPAALERPVHDDKIRNVTSNASDEPPARDPSNEK
jgi:hypothetical protein